MEQRPILFSGLTAAGKSNYSKLIAELLGRPWFDATSQMLELLDIPNTDQCVWTTDVARDMQEARIGDELDKRLDSLTVGKLHKIPNAVVDAWAMPWLWKGDAVRVFVVADEDTRIKRCLASYPLSSSATVGAARKLIEEKDNFTRDLFLRLYNFDLFNDHNIFDIVLDTSGFVADTPEKTGKQIAQERILPIARRAIMLVLNRDYASELDPILKGALDNGTVKITHLT